MKFFYRRCKKAFKQAKFWLKPIHVTSETALSQTRLREKSSLVVFRWAKKVATSSYDDTKSYQKIKKNPPNPNPNPNPHLTLTLTLTLT